VKPEQRAWRSSSFGLGRGAFIARFGASLALCVLCGLGCRSQAERETSAEVERMMVRVRALRDAASNDKLPSLELLRAEKCATPQGCELQQVCVQGYGLYERAQKATRTIREAMAGGAANPAMVAELLQANETELGRAKALMDQCLAIEGRLIRNPTGSPNP
jgi:hypothetical protein